MIGAPGDSWPLECVDVSQNVPETGLDPGRQYSTANHSKYGNR